MSKLLKQLLKNSLLPAALMIVAKLLGLFLAVKFFDMNVYLGNELQGLFSVQVYIDNSQDTVLANTISNGVMLTLLLIGYLYLITRYLLYSKSTHDPRTIVKLAKFNLVRWVTDKNNVFTRIFCWAIFVLSACAVMITSAVSSSSYSWAGLVAFTWAIFIIWTLIRTFEIETDKIYPKNNPDYL